MCEKKSESLSDWSKCHEKYLQWHLWERRAPLEKRTKEGELKRRVYRRVRALGKVTQVMKMLSCLSNTKDVEEKRDKDAYVLSSSYDITTKANGHDQSKETSGAPMSIFGCFWWPQHWRLITSKLQYADGQRRRGVGASKSKRHFWGSLSIFAPTKEAAFFFFFAIVEILWKW